MMSTKLLLFIVVVEQAARVNLFCVIKGEPGKGNKRTHLRNIVSH